MSQPDSDHYSILLKSSLVRLDTDGSVATDDDDQSLSSSPQEPAINPLQPQKSAVTQERKPEAPEEAVDSVDGPDRNVGEDENNSVGLTPIQGNITQDQAVWELANNIGKCLPQSTYVK